MKPVRFFTSKDTTKIKDKIETEKTFVRYMTKDQQYQFTKTTISKMGEGQGRLGGAVG